MNEWNFIIAAYAVAWALIIGYALYLARAVKRARSLAAEAVGQGGAS